jgi:alpha-glucosidase
MPASVRCPSVGDWWRNAVLYEIYPRSFADSDGDGVGDLRGITAHLDHLEWLGIEGVWLNPTTPSPDADWGYDVSDYTGVQPVLGTVADLDELVREAGRRGIRILLDLVPNHTSIVHPWFVDARTSRDARHRNWYVWADPAPGGGPPNNWVSTFAGPAWTLDEHTGQYFLHNFLPEQPDLDWWNDEVRDEFDRILRFWFDRGVAGFRIDVAHMIVKDRELRDNPPATKEDSLLDQMRGQRPVYNSMRPEMHDVHRRWRALCETYDEPRVLVGETYVGRISEVAPFYGDGDELNLAFNIPFVHAVLDANGMRSMVEETEASIPAGCTPVWTGSNHDVQRFPTRWARNDPGRARCALMMLLTLRGSVFLHYGDELLMPDTEVPRDRLRDPVSINLYGIINRDAGRTPMQWVDESGAGFTAADVEPWLPFGDVASCNVEAQQADPTSALHLTRDLVRARRELPDLRDGAYASLPSPDGVWAWKRGESVVVAINLGDDTATLEGLDAMIRIGTDRLRDGETVTGSLPLRPGEGAVLVERPPPSM